MLPACQVGIAINIVPEHQNFPVGSQYFLLVLVSESTKQMPHNAQLLYALCDTAISSKPSKVPSNTYLHQPHTSLSHPPPLHWAGFQELPLSSAKTSVQTAGPQVKGMVTASSNLAVLMNNVQC